MLKTRFTELGPDTEHLGSGVQKSGPVKEMGVNQLKNRAMRQYSGAIG